ncbi:MAG: glycosyltransferase [Atopobiaceae bacterium]
MEPKVSIIVPVYNAEKKLERCIDSILGQEFTDIELILADDGSTDSSGAICDAYGKRDPRAHVIHKPNSGVSSTRNIAMDAAQGTYIQFLDSDDWITPDATKLLVRGIEENGCDMVIADFYRVIGSRVARKSDIDSEDVITREQYADLMLESPSDFYWGVVWNKLYKRSIIEDHHIRMDPSISWCEDFIFNMEYVLHTARIYPLHVPIYYYEKTKGSLATQGASLANTVRMKLNVIEYYKSFYQKIMDEDDYAARRPDIYRFYIDSASDGGVLPGPLSTKLGRERVTAQLDPDMAENPLAILYLAQKLLDRYLDVAGCAHDLELQDMKVLLYLRDCGTCGTFKEIAEYCGCTQSQAARAMGHLKSRGFVRIGTAKDKDQDSTQDNERKTADVEILEPAEPILASLATALDDFDHARLSELGRSEAETYLAAEAKEYDSLVESFS